MIGAAQKILVTNPAMVFPTESCPKKCPSTTSASSTSNISPTTSTPKSSKRAPTCGSTGSRTKARPMMLHADPVGGACLSDRRGARRTGAAFSCRQGSAEADAESADRFLQRRGFRSRRCRRLHGSRRGGRQPVRRQRQFGRRACARHDDHAFKAHSRIRPRAAARAQRQPQCADRQRGQGQDRRHHRHRQCRPPHRRALQGPAAHEGPRLRSRICPRRKSPRGAGRRSNSTISCALPISCRSPVP